MINLTLPTPPTLNQLFAGNGRIRYKSKKYKEWIGLASEAYYKQGEEYQIHGDEWLEAKYTYYTKIWNNNGTKKVKDVANYEKALSDFLTTVIVGFEDHHIKKITLEKIESDRNEVEIEIKEIKE